MLDSPVTGISRAAERIEGAGQIQKVGPHQMGCVRGVWWHAPGNFEILHAVKCVLGAPETLFRACTQCIYTCKFPSSISGSRSKSMTSGALASGLCSSHVR